MKKWMALILIPTVCSALSRAFETRLESANLMMIFLFGIIYAASQFGQWVAVGVTLINVLCFDLFFVEPKGSLSVHNLQYLISFALMLVVGFYITHLLNKIKLESLQNKEQSDQFHQLYLWALELSNTSEMEQLLQMIPSHMQMFGIQNFGLKISQEGASKWLKNCELQNQNIPFEEWAYAHGKEIGSGTPLLNGIGALVLPLGEKSEAIHGILILEGDNSLFKSAFTVSILKSYANLILQTLVRFEQHQKILENLHQIQIQKTQNHLLTLLSHDLKTPLSSLFLHLENTPEAVLNESQSALWKKELDKETLRIKSLTDNILDWIRLQQKQQFQMEWQDLEDIVGSSVQMTSPQFSQNLSIEWPKNVPFIWCNALFIQRVFINLFDNAYKYGSTPYLLKIEIQEQFFNISLSQNIKMPYDQELNIEELSADNHHKSNKNFGLLLCKNILEFHRGQLSSKKSSNRFEVLMRIPLLEMNHLLELGEDI